MAKLTPDLEQAHWQLKKATAALTSARKSPKERDSYVRLARLLTAQALERFHTVQQQEARQKQEPRWPHRDRGPCPHGQVMGRRGCRELGQYDG